LTGNLNTARYGQTANLLTNGLVLITGGTGGNYAELYNFTNGLWSNTGIMARQYATTTLLPNGMVLVANGGTTIAALYNPATGTWADTGPMNSSRNSSTATLLADGQVLVAGGINPGSQLFYPNAELYDPKTGTWTTTGPLNFPRELHQAALLPNGKVLIAGGSNDAALGRAELYDPASGQWSLTGSMLDPRSQFTMTLLPNGLVLAAGGQSGTADLGLTAAELYNPTNGVWTLTGSLNTPRFGHTATLLPNGKVLVVGGLSGLNNTVASMELYDPATGKWTVVGSLINARGFHTATLLPDNQVLIAAGSLQTGSTVTPLATAELFDAGLGYSNSWRPQITFAPTSLNLDASLVVTGAQFRGFADGSSGNSQDSSTSYPLLQLHSLEGGQMTFLSTTNWGTNSFASLPVTGFPPGYALATIFVNGIPSTSSIVNVNVPLPARTRLTGEQQVNGAFQFNFTNSPGALFAVLATTNLSLPLTNWTQLGGVVEVTPGQFQFTDPSATNNAQRFYLLLTP
jgi:hypothetical protein